MRRSESEHQIQTSGRMLVVTNNRLYAMIVLSLTGGLLVYYTLWVIGLPFVDPVYLHYVSWLFPPIHLAFVIPAGLASLVSGSLFLQVLYLVNKERRKGEARLKQS